MTGRVTCLCVAAIVLAGATWSDPYATAREAERAYARDDFDAAAEKYNQALVDMPDSRLLQYNLAASEYRRGEFGRAVAAYGGMSADDPDSGGIAYNAGNALFRLGSAAEQEGPEKALEYYTAAVAAYRRAMGADPADLDAKHNHEVVERKIAELRKKQEEQQQEQSPPQEQQGDPSQRDEPQSSSQDEKSDAAPSDNEGDGKPREEPSEQRAEAEQDESSSNDASAQSRTSPEAPEAEQDAESRHEATPEASDGESTQGRDPTSAAAAGNTREGEMTEREAQALLDAARDQEMHPAEIIRRQQDTRVLDPEQDW
jgi:hypothetical protein